MIADTIAEYVEAKAKLDKAKSNCDSSWGYWLYDQIENVKKLGEKIEDEIKEIVQKGR